jgi:hypothetical protein
MLTWQPLHLLCPCSQTFTYSLDQIQEVLDFLAGRVGLGEEQQAQLVTKYPQVGGVQRDAGDNILWVPDISPSDNYSLRCGLYSYPTCTNCQHASAHLL